MAKDDHKPNAMLTETEAAEILGVEKRTLQDWRQRQKHGQPPFYKLPAIRYRYSDLMEWLKTKRVEF